MPHAPCSLPYTNRATTCLPSQSDRIAWFDSYEPWLEAALALEYSPLALVAEKSFWEAFLRRPTLTEEVIGKLVGCMHRRGADIHTVHEVRLWGRAVLC